VRTFGAGNVVLLLEALENLSRERTVEEAEELLVLLKDAAGRVVAELADWCRG
jgi:hypothetical protein